MPEKLKQCPVIDWGDLTSLLENPVFTIDTQDFRNAGVKILSVDTVRALLTLTFEYQPNGTQPTMSTGSTSPSRRPSESLSRFATAHVVLSYAGETFLEP